MASGYVIVKSPDWDLKIERLRVADDTLNKRLKDALRDTATPVEADLRRAALGLPAHKAKHTGLRARIAKGVGAKAEIYGMRFTTSMDVPNEAYLPRGEDSGILGWRHPVYGNRNNWVHQIGGSWFRSTIANDRGSFENDLTNVLDKVAHQIAGH